MSDEQYSSAPTIAQLVDNLFKSHVDAHGREYTYQAVSDALQGELEPSYILKLRQGKISNPGRKTLKLLCIFFQVSPLYFFPDLPSYAFNAEKQSGLHEVPSIRVALRSSGLEADAQEYVEKLIELLQRKQQSVSGDE